MMLRVINLENEEELMSLEVRKNLKNSTRTDKVVKAMEVGDTKVLLKMIHDCEFEVLVNKDGTLSLEDLQGGNLAGIESEKFETITDVCERLEDSYFEDYFFGEVE